MRQRMRRSILGQGCMLRAGADGGQRTHRHHATGWLGELFHGAPQVARGIHIALVKARLVVRLRHTGQMEDCPHIPHGRGQALTEGQIAVNQFNSTGRQKLEGTTATHQTANTAP